MTSWLEPVRHHPDDRKHPGLPLAAALDVEAAHREREDRRRRRHRARLGQGPARVQQPAAEMVAVAVLHHHRLRPAVPRVLSRASAISPASSGWTQAGQYEQERAAVEARAAALLAPLAALPVAELVNNEQAMSTAHNLFQQNCAQCHGSDGGGAVGFPNLRDADWQWGSDADTVVATIAGGRVAAMPPWGRRDRRAGRGRSRRVRADAERPAGRCHEGGGGPGALPDALRRVPWHGRQGQSAARRART